MADLNSNNSFDSNMGTGLGPLYQNDVMVDYSASAFSSAFTTINDHASGSTRTVSPKELMKDPYDPFSAPPSTAMTNITTPDSQGVFDSPYMTDSFNTSPMFQIDSVSASNDWFPLFENEEDQAPALSAVKPPPAPALERTISSSSMARTSSSSASPAPIILDASHRRRSSTTASPALNAGISKPRRRKGPLPPILVDENDKVAMKRARNTLAARESRQRKQDLVQTLEQQNKELRDDVEKWKNIALRLGYAE